MESVTPIQSRVIVVGLVNNGTGEFLICRMPSDRGVFPGQWGLPGGGIEPNETMETALRRELREELGVEISEIKPLFFSDGHYQKALPEGRRELYLIFLIFSCRANSSRLNLNSEFTDYAWVKPSALGAYDLNQATVETFCQAGIMTRPIDKESFNE